MKKFFVIFALMIALCLNSFAQKKAAIDPCLSKDPKVRATSKKPCPSAPAPKKTNPPPKPTKGTDDGETSDNSQDSDDSQSNGKTGKKTNPPVKNKPAKPTDYLGTFFFITIMHNGEKTELANTQFEEGGGNAMLENERSGRMIFFYGASNSKMNDNQFMFQGMIASPTIGTFAFGNGVTFSFNTDRFPKVPIFLCDGGNYEIEAVPLKGGFVTGSFTANCVGEINPDGTSEKYTMSGRFKLLRQ